MSDRRQVWATLAALLQRLEANVTEENITGRATFQSDLEGIKQEVRKLGKEQLKANALAEDQATRWQETVATLQATRAQNEQLATSLSQEQQVAARHKLLEAILPALDGVEHAIASGQQYLARRDKAAGNPKLTPDQAWLVSPADRTILASWLDGLRLVRERLLAILEAGEVTPIPTVGHLFDPYLHRAVSTTAEGQGKTGTIVREERRGYLFPGGVLRYAEVVVYKPNEVIGDHNLPSPQNRKLRNE